MTILPILLKSLPVTVIAVAVAGGVVACFMRPGGP
jgi:hypothetical protein